MPTPEAADQRSPFPVAAIVNVLGVLLTLLGAAGFAALGWWIHPWLGLGLLSAYGVASGWFLMTVDLQEHN